VTLAELVEVLTRAIPEHGHREVLGTWEGISCDIAAIYVDRPRGNRLELAEGGAVLIDVDENRYFGEQADPAIAPLWLPPEAPTIRVDEVTTIGKITDSTLGKLDPSAKGPFTLRWPRSE
jgi:hypothetical protein